MSDLTKKEDNWRCDFCHEEKDVLYFHGNEEICEECRKKIRGSHGYTGKT